eukprot:Skav227306  [mRNA]  locus=scaffold2645:311589:318475:- [translate_table: standard]
MAKPLNGLVAGANPSAQRDQPEPSMEEFSDGPVAKVLLDFGANPNDADSPSARSVAVAIWPGEPRLDTTWGSAGGAAGEASSRGDPALMKLLLDARCDAERLDDRQDGLLAWAKGGEVVQLLLEAQADPAQRGVGGQTPLMYACERGDLAAARALAEAGDDRSLLSALSDSGESAWSLAMSNGHEESWGDKGQKAVCKGSVLDQREKTTKASTGRLEATDLAKGRPALGMYHPQSWLILRQWGFVVGHLPFTIAVGSELMW